MSERMNFFFGLKDIYMYMNEYRLLFFFMVTFSFSFHQVTLPYTRAEEIPIMCRLYLPTVVIFLLLFLLFLLFLLLLLLPSTPPVLHTGYNTALSHDPPYSSHKHSYAQANHAVDTWLNSMLQFHIYRRFVKGIYS